MWVKCPKCRFRFDQPGGDNGEEIQCVCPRCGTPFTFTANASDGLSKDAEESKDEADSHNGASPLRQSQSACGHQGDRGETTVSEETRDQPASSFASNISIPSNAATSYDTAASSDVSSSDNSSSDFRRPPSYQRLQTPYNRTDSTSVKVNNHQKHGKSRFILGLLVVLVLAFLLTHECSGDNDSPKDLGIEEVSDANVPAVEDVATPAFDASAPEEKAPSWIQGTWKVNTKYGGIMVSIRDNRITETSAGETSHGTFHYQHHRLYCDFGNGETFVYRLDMKAQQIDAGQGLMMKKLDQ